MSDGDFLWGVTFFLALLAAVLALPITWLLLRRYRKSILRLMNERGVMAQGSPGSVEPAPGTPARSDRSIKWPPEGDVIEAGIRRNVAVVVIIGALGGLAFATLFLAWNEIEFSPYRVAVFAVLYAWPAVLGTWIVTGANRRWVIGSVATYFVLFLTAGLIGGVGLLEPLVLWAWTLIPTLAVIAFLSRPMRGAGTLVLGVMMAGIVGSQAFSLAIVESEALLGAWVDTAFAFGITDAALMFFGMQLLGFLGAVLVGILITRGLAGSYSRQGFSDQMLLLGSVFLVFAIDHAVSASPSDAGAFGVGLGIYAALALVAMLLYRFIHRSPRQTASLLMLRVFSPLPGSQRLLDRISARWRYLGPVRMIGGPDLAIASVEPDEFLTFVSGRLRRLFIVSPAVLEERLGSLSNRSDPDARFRIDEFFCFDDTWRLTVAELLRRSDVVLMDLRAFGPDNDGCIDEIELLAADRALSRTVLLVDASSDRQLLDDVLGPLTDDGGPTLILVDDDFEADQAVAACLTAASGDRTSADSRFPESD